MKNRNFLSKISLIVLVFVLTAAMALGMTACSEKPVDDSSSIVSTVSGTATNIGEGETQFKFTVVDGEGNEKAFNVKTDETTVGAALLGLKLIEGEEGQYGLYVKTVNGITADYDVDGTYWAFYVNGEYATSGVDATNITAGDEYSFKVEK